MSGAALSYAGYGVAWAFSLLFFVSALAKSLDIQAFRAAIAQFEAVGSRLVPAASYAVIAVEALLAVGFAHTIALPLLYPVAGAMLLGFTLLLARAARRRVAIACHCFGGSSDKATNVKLAIIRNASLIAAGAIGWTIQALEPVQSGSAWNPLIVCCAAFCCLLVREMIDSRPRAAAPRSPSL